MEAKTAHDPGGKVRLRPPAGTYCNAVFSECGRYRPMLRRIWDPGPAVLWIGMNPSIADGTVDDPTIAKECRMSRRWGYGGYFKGNVSDYRATSPKDLDAYARKGGSIWSRDNLLEIKAAAESSALIIIACGVLMPALAPPARRIVNFLRENGHPIYIMGLTKDGWPRHSLYLREDTKPVWFNHDLPDR